MRNFYQDEGKLPEQCSETLRAMDDALVAYNADHQRAVSSVAAVADSLTALRRNVEARDSELIEYHKFRAAVAKGQGGPDADERERQFRSSFEASNEQVRREAETAYANRVETFHDSYNQIMGMFATLFSSLSTALTPLVAGLLLLSLSVSSFRKRKSSRHAHSLLSLPPFFVSHLPDPALHSDPRGETSATVAANTATETANACPCACSTDIAAAAAA